MAFLIIHIHNIIMSRTWTLKPRREVLWGLEETTLYVSPSAEQSLGLFIVLSDTTVEMGTRYWFP